MAQQAQVPAAAVHQVPHYAGRIVAAAVIHDDHLELLRQLRQNLERSSYCNSNALLLVERRHYH